MTASRRRALRIIGVASLSSLAGCFAVGPLGRRDTTEYTLSVRPIDATPTEYALFEPPADPPFSAPARVALDDILPDGRHTTYGYRPLPSDAYVAHRNRYYRIEYDDGGAEQRVRTVVRTEPVPGESAPERTIPIDSLDRASARVLKLLHRNHQTGRAPPTSLHDDGYVLRRPAELEGQLGTGSLDGRLVTLAAGNGPTYRVEIGTERIDEPAYTAFAVEVADSPTAFRDVVFDTRIDADISTADLHPSARDRLDRAIDTGETSEVTPLSEPFVGILDALHLTSVETTTNGRLLWYADALYRYGLYVNGE